MLGVEHLGLLDRSRLASRLADDPAVYFTTPHFDGYPAVLVLLERIPVDELEELVVEACLTQAPKRLAQEYLES